MELTQKLEYTQEMCYNSEKEFPEQIGFLGICGVKYPLKKGPNKIGRDPDTCNIVLNLNCISRQHAVINILNSYDFMLMDLDSANKTKVGDITLQAYIPHPIKNGDMVQFGQVFGVFRLFEEDNELPMTQALDVPETPVRNNRVSKVNNLVTTIPESPDVSDRDDSFIVASQPKPKNVFKSPNTNFIKSSGKSVSIKPVGLNKIDNAYWSSSKKSDSFSLESDTSRNDIDVCLKSSEVNQNIHEEETQCFVSNKSNNAIYEAETEVAENIQPFIHSMETQLSEVNNLPEVFKIQGQENINLDLFTGNKENDNNIYNSETQDVSLQKGVGTAPISEKNNDSSNKRDTSDDIILFDEINCSPPEDNIGSQQLLIPELEAGHVEHRGKSEKSPMESKQPSNRRDSGSSTDCEDIYFALTQKIPENKYDDDETDCEDEPEVSNKVNKESKTIENSKIDDDLTDCEDNIESKDQKEPSGSVKQTLEIGEEKPSHYKINTGTRNKTSLEDLSTKVDGNKNCEIDRSKDIIDFEDMPTQILNHISPKISSNNCETDISKEAIDFEDMPTQILNHVSQNIYSEEVVTPFKVPAISPLKRRRKNQEAKVFKLITDENIPANIENDDEEKYYDATQELLNDLCTQRDPSPGPISGSDKKDVTETQTNKTINNKPDESNLDTDDIDEKIDRFVMKLTDTDASRVDEENKISSKKSSSDSSDVESTPKKLNPFFFLNVELPNTQEIKMFVKSTGETSAESSLESDTDCLESKPRRKTRKPQKAIVKLRSLSAKFDAEEHQRVPRVRKLTYKTQNCVDIATKKSKKDIQSGLLEYENNINITGETVLANKTDHTYKSRRSTRKSDNEIKGLNKSKEINNKKKKDIEENKSKEIVKSRRQNNMEENNAIKEKNRSKDKTNVENNIKNYKDTGREKTKESKSAKNSLDTITEKKLERNQKRGSNKTKEKENEVKGDDKQIEVKKLEQAKSSDSQRSTRSKSNRTENNTIDKYLCATPVQEAQNNEKRRNIEKGSESTEKGNRSSGKGSDNTEKGTSSTKKESASTEQGSGRKEKGSRSVEKRNKNTVKGGTGTEKLCVSASTTETGSRISDKSSRSTEKGSRNTRKGGRNSDKITEATEKKSTSTDTGSKTKNKDIENIEAVVETEIRRSQRKRTAKKCFEIESKPQLNHEQSTVYNISSESGVESPKLKRQASELSLPSSKKSKTCSSYNVTLRATSARKIKTQYVLFTAFPCDEVKFKLEKLGAVIVTDLMQCTVVLTLQIKRTFKLLCAVGLGKPIVGPNWVQACVDTNMIVDPWLYLIKDEQTEKRFHFNLERILTGGRQFLKGYNVSSTPNVLPSPSEMKLIVECSGGSWTAGGKNWICVSSNTDKALWAGIKRRGATIVSTEFILGGVLRQKMDIDRNILL